MSYCHFNLRLNECVSCPSQVLPLFNPDKDQMSEKGDLKEVETEVLNEKQGSIIMGIIAQLRKGSDLSKVTLPTFVLEPRSMLERITDFMSHPDLIMQ
jgi:hypothetical protein